MIHKTSPEIGGMGHSIKRKEDLRFIQGKGNYVDDVRLPGMVYGQMVRSPYAHARLKSINTEKAKALPGVLAVITGEDLAKANLAWMPTLSYDKQMVLATGQGSLPIAGSRVRRGGRSLHCRRCSGLSRS